MTSEAWPKATTITSWRSRFLAILFVVLGGACAALAPFAGRSWPLWAAVAELALVAIAAAGLLYWSFRLGVCFDDHGVTIRRIFQTDRYGWPEVSRFAGGCEPDGEGPYLWALNVVLAGGRPVTVTATKRKDPASPKILAAIRQVAERYQIPAHLTGTARTLEGLPANPRRASRRRRTRSEPRDDPGGGQVLVTRQSFVTADPAVGVVPARCRECAAETGEAVQVCARCGAPVAREWSGPEDA